MMEWFNFRRRSQEPPQDIEDDWEMLDVAALPLEDESDVEQAELTASSRVLQQVMENLDRERCTAPTKEASSKPVAIPGTRQTEPAARPARALPTTNKPITPADLFAEHTQQHALEVAMADLRVAERDSVQEQRAWCRKKPKMEPGHHATRAPTAELEWTPQPYASASRPTAPRRAAVPMQFNPEVIREHWMRWHD